MMKPIFAVLALCCGYVLAAEDKSETIKIEITATEEKPKAAKEPEAPVKVTVWDAAKGRAVELVEAVKAGQRRWEQVPMTPRDRLMVSDGMQVLDKRMAHQRAEAEYIVWRDSWKLN